MMPVLLLDEVLKKRPEISRGAPQDRQEFTGERFLPGYSDGSIELQHMHRYSFALPFATGRTVVDIGCGEGYGCDLLAHVASSVTGVDIDDEIITTARNRYRRANLNFRAGHTSAVPIESNSADLIVSFETLEHLSDHESFWSEIKRILKATGLLIISSPNRDVYNAERETPNVFHKRELSQLEFANEIARHFRTYSLFSQSTLLGSAITPVAGPSGMRTVVSVDPNTGVLNWKTGDEIVQPFSIAIASNDNFPIPGESLYTGDYPANAMASLTAGIAERDQEIRNLKAAAVAKAVAPSGSTLAEALVARTDEIGILKITLAEQARTINSMRTLLDECTRQMAKARISRCQSIVAAGNESERS